MGIKIVTTLISAKLSSYDLTTLAVVKDELDITGGAKDATLERYISSASSAAAQYCNRKFQQETLQDEFWPDRDAHPWQLPTRIEKLQLSRWPVAQPVISLTENGVTLVEGTDFRVDYAAGQLIRLGADAYPATWCAWPIVAQFKGGFDEIPDDVADAVIRMVSRRYAAKGQDPNLKQLSVPGVIEKQWWIASGQQAGNMSPDITDILDNYRVPLVA